ncbi:MAG: GNAT family N-acetyltransferase [Ignavibacterium sp.]|nr:GNAT family N-acetyltransferase [Ignavibacterium sp.]
MIPSEVEIRKINIAQSKELSDLLLQSDREYSKYFIPFEFDIESVSKVMGKAVKDMFYGIYVNSILVGFYMLRGWDAGYDIPSYGVWISENFSSKGLSKLTLHHAISICKINKVKKLMLKVHPDNITAKRIYEDFGFTFNGIDEKIGHLVYYKNIK